MRKAVDLYQYGLLRSSDWLPVGGDEKQEHLRRSVDSISSSGDDESSSESSDADAHLEPGHEYPMSSQSSGCSEISDYGHTTDDEGFQCLIESMEMIGTPDNEWDSLFEQ